MALITVSVTDGIGQLRLNRPQARNAFNRELIDAFRRQLEVLADRDDLKALVISGASNKKSGKPVFAAGADIAELLTRTAQDAFAARLQKLFQEVEDFPRPVIAAIDGFALGGGLELALACDLRVAARTALLGLPEVGLGIFPSAGTAVRLPRLVGLGYAKLMVLTGQLISAETAHERGLVDVLVAENALAGALEAAGRIARHDAAAVRVAKAVMNGAAAGGRGAPLEWLGQASLVDSKEKKRRMQAFLSKRT